MILSNYVYIYTGVPQQYHETDVQSSECAASQVHASQPMDHKKFFSPPCYHSSGEKYAVTVAEEMTVDQTANWIKTFGKCHGWEQVDLYAKNFREQGITGVCLKELTADMLEFPLGIKDKQQQQELFSAIQYLYPSKRMQTTPYPYQHNTSTQIPHSSCSSVYHSRGLSVGSDYEGTNMYLAPSFTLNTAQTGLHECNDMFSESGYSQRSFGVSHSGSEFYFMNQVNSVRSGQDNMDIDMVGGKTLECSRKVKSSRACIPLRCRKLLLHLPEDKTASRNDDIHSIRARFHELKIQVEVLPMEDKPNIYTLVCPNYEHAEEVLSRAHEIGYKIKKKWPPRPNPNRPLKYKSMAELQIRVGKAFSGRVVGKLNKGDIVTVNQVKGRRARLITEKEGKVVNIGWVSLHRENGVTLLKQIGDF